MSTTKPVRPLCLGRSGSVRQMISPMSEYCAPEVHTFWPVMTHSSPSRSALVCRPARSDPAPGSLKSWQPTRSARYIAGRYLRLDVVLRVVLDRRRHHAEADAEEALAGHLVLALEAAVEPVVAGGQLAAAVLPWRRRCSRGRRRSAWPATPWRRRGPSAPGRGRPLRTWRRRRRPRPTRTSCRPRRASLWRWRRGRPGTRPRTPRWWAGRPCGASLVAADAT